MVLTPVTMPFLEASFGRRSWARGAPSKLLGLMHANPDHADEQPVVVAHCQVRLILLTGPCPVLPALETGGQGGLLTCASKLLTPGGLRLFSSGRHH